MLKKKKIPSFNGNNILMLIILIVSIILNVYLIGFTQEAKSISEELDYLKDTITFDGHIDCDLNGDGKDERVTFFTAQNQVDYDLGMIPTGWDLGAYTTLEGETYQIWFNTVGSVKSVQAYTLSDGSQALLVVCFGNVQDDVFQINFRDNELLITPLFTETMQNEEIQYYNELQLYKENYEREQAIRTNIWENYRYTINEISPFYDSQTAMNIITEIDYYVINAIDAKDFTLLKEYVHPEKGVRISCFNESSTTDIILSSEDLIEDSVYTWENEGGSGNSIEMSVEEVFRTLLYSRDYIQYEPIYMPYKLQDYINGNEYVFYDKCISVLYLYEGDKSANWLDWSGIKLIYQDHEDGHWYLTGIIHCEREL